MLVIRARLAEESVSHYGDNGLPELAAQVTAAAKTAGPLPFEPPHVFRKRMRALSDWTKGVDARTSAVTGPSGRETSFPGASTMSVPIIGWKGERVRLVPPDRTLHLENALRWMNDPEITAALKFNLGISRQPGGGVLRSDRESG